MIDRRSQKFHKEFNTNGLFYYVKRRENGKEKVNLIIICK